jgi:hypothetical protein
MLRQLCLNPVIVKKRVAGGFSRVGLPAENPIANESVPTEGRDAACRVGAASAANCFVLPPGQSIANEFAPTGDPVTLAR